MAPRAKKAADAPKRGRSAYIYFMQEQTKELKALQMCHWKSFEAQADNPDMKMTEISKELGPQWKALSDAEKAPYKKLAAADKVRAAQELAAYEAKKAGKAPPQAAKPVPVPEESEDEEGDDEEDD